MLAATAISQSATDPLSGLVLRDVPRPRPQPWWSRVRVVASWLNMHDLWTLRGVGHPPGRLPIVLGCDAAGYDEDGNEVIVHPVLGARCSVLGDPDASRGDETLDPDRALLSERHDGAFAEYLTLPTRNLVPKPAWLSFLASGGLSHDPPVPVLDGAPPRVADALTEGRPPTPEQRAKGEQRVVRAGRDHAAGSTAMIPVDPAWDNRLLDHLKKGELAEFDSWTVAGMAQEGGGSGHGVRTWIAAFASLAATGPYAMTSRFYEPIPAWTAGFAVATARRSGGGDRRGTDARRARAGGPGGCLTGRRLGRERSHGGKYSAATEADPPLGSSFEALTRRPADRRHSTDRGRVAQ